MIKLAILQVADTSPLESLVVMLQSVGIKCAIPSRELKQELRRIGCDTVLDIENLVKGMGYDWPMPLPEAGTKDMERRDVLYVDIKAHRNTYRVWERWPHLKDRVLWYRINGGKPEHVVNARGDHGDEVNPPCPMLTPNQWYRDDPVPYSEWKGCGPLGGPSPGPNWGGLAYACWPPFATIKDYSFTRHISKFHSPICLIHRVDQWSYQELIPHVRELGVKLYGEGSPDGLLQHREVPIRLGTALAMVHLKSSDAPGYAIYEALASGCPLICTRRLIWRCRMEELLIPGKTCLVFDRETHDGLTQEDVVECRREIAEHLQRLGDPAENRRIGEAGRQRLNEIMWSASKKEDVESLRQFMQRNFG